ncbi:ribonuclease P protein subunit p40 [Paramormyrops kingsleyae]|uniref:Ribonuclease P/MRP 40 subunit n=1 Tax=Paramormyrops kingsleyae TaxID=1676925 RepID=A0A3B3RUN1_9TELE|nr:ribonuclease P protein subunit p40 [Paramormyrops kingsleyae]
MHPELQQSPRNILVFEKSNFMNEKSRHDLHVLKHYFNYKVSVFIPECGILPSELNDAISRFTKYYLVKDLPVHELLEEECLEKTVKKGRFYALSYNRRIDQDDVVAILPTGQMILSVNKDTYEQLGLEGKESQYTHKQPMRYVVTVDLTDKSMLPGSKRYNRVLWALKEKVPVKMDFLLARHSTEANEGGMLPSCLSQYHCRELQASISTQKLSSLPYPVLCSCDIRGEGYCEPHQFLEWLGAVTMEIDCNNDATSFMSTYSCPEQHNTLSQALLCSITGLLLPEDIQSLLEKLRSYFEQPKLTSWLSLVVHGFADSPVSWGMEEHGFHKGGENFYGFVVFGNQDYWLHMGTGANDGCPP